MRETKSGEKEGEDQGRGQERDVPVRGTEVLLEAEDTADAHPRLLHGAAAQGTLGIWVQVHGDESGGAQTPAEASAECGE